MTSHHLKLISIEISKSPAVDIYELHVRLRISPSQLVDAMKLLNDVGAARLVGGKIYRRKNWKSAMLKHRYQLFSDQDFKEVPEKLRSKPDFNRPYIPDFELIGPDGLNQTIQEFNTDLAAGKLGR